MITLEKALELSRAQFLDYARQHRAKNSPEAFAKAVVNDDMADMISEALAAHRARVEGDREAVARRIAHDHFDRRPWAGACTKAARTAWLVNQYWPQFAHTADAILALVQQDHAPSVGGDGQ